MLKNVIFDLGTVLLHIDTQYFWTYLEDLGFDTSSLEGDNELFEAFELGEIAIEDFLDAIAMHIGPVNANEVVKAWQGIILSPSKEGLQTVAFCRKMGLNTYILSNTNELHHQRFTHVFDQELGADIYPSLFNELFYSHQIGELKPQAEIYEHLINLGILAQESLFIDDKLENVEAAQKLGFQTFHYTSLEDWHDFERQINTALHQ